MLQASRLTGWRDSSEGACGLAPLLCCPRQRVHAAAPLNLWR